MDTTDLEPAIRQILAAHSKLARRAAEVGADADLFAAGLDSFAVVNVMLALEERFAFEFPEQDLTRETFSSIRKIAAVIQRAGLACPC